MDDSYFKKIVTMIALAILIVLSFFILRPILIAIIFGVILAFVLSPVEDWMSKKLKSRTLSATIISVALIILLILPIWFLTPIIINQSLKIYFSTQQMDFVTPLKNILPSIFASQDFSREIGSIIYSFVNKSVNSFVNYFSGFILNFPILLMQFGVAFFTFYFVLRDKENLISYIKSLLPFSRDVEEKIFEQTKGITISVLYGQIIMGLIQGFITGAGFLIFGVPNALILTILACIAGILPIIGTTVVWVPVAIYLLVIGNPIAAIGITIFGLIAVFIDNILKPIFVSRRVSMPSSLVLIGMVGGFLFFGVLGFILGPLILAYLLILLEVYRNKRIPGILVQEPAQKIKISI
ncbi:MAG TPA: AI-2E family transporter [Candidatus Nanoarchaeia archaeon]|nr:AI-2E family transporter [Candidatus Nanoarchaeia archaeon]